MKDIIEVKKANNDNNDSDDTVRSEINTSKTKQKSRKIPYLVIGLLLVGAIASSVYFYNQYRSIKANPSQAQNDKNKAETARVMDNLKKILFLPETDAPTVARVEDPNKLKEANKEFYKDVQKGDYLVIYPKKAIIYREANNQIMNIAPIINTADLQKTKDQTQGTTQPTNNATTNKTTR